MSLPLRANIMFLCLAIFVIGRGGLVYAKVSPESQKTQANQEEAILEEPPLSAEAKAAREDIARILEGPDFNREVVHKTWRFKDKEELQKENDIPEWFIRIVEFLESFFLSEDTKQAGKNRDVAMLLAQGLEFLLWVVGISIIILIVYHYRDYIKSLVREITSKSEPVREQPTLLFGLDVTQESLPDNVPDQVMELWRQGASREALGLLYRATLSGLIHQYDFKFSESATEKECADIVSQSSMNSLDSYMQRLTRIWQRLAYGHRLPDETDVVGLCERWPEMFSHGV